VGSNNVLVEVISCDLCAVNSLNWVPPAKSAERLKFLRKKSFPPAGYLVGTVKDALKEGWEEREYGVICPPCIVNEQEQAKRDKEEKAESFVGVPAEALNVEDELQKLDEDEKAAEATIAIWIEQNPEGAEQARADLAEYKREVAEAREQVKKDIEALKAEAHIAAEQSAVEVVMDQKENVVA
jgi:hypothetical protein